MNSAISTNPTIPHFDQYLGLWHYESQRFSRGLDLVRAMDVSAHLRRTPAGRDFAESHVAERAERGEQLRGALTGGEQLEIKSDVARQSVRNGYSYDVIDGVALVSIEGSLMKHASSYDNSTSTAMTRNTVRGMRANQLVRGVILVIDSPGGTVAGAYDLAADIEALAKDKPTYAYGENCLCSAAYLQAAMTRGISVNQNCIAGSIGTYGAVYDYSKMFEKEGVKAILLGSGGVKGAGLMGTEITDEQIAEWMKNIDELNGLFIDHVARGRKMATARAKELADGRTYVGKEAVKIGLVQKVESLDQLYARVRKEIGPAATSAGGMPLNSAGGASLTMTSANGHTISIQGSNADEVLKLRNAVNAPSQVAVPTDEPAKDQPGDEGQPDPEEPNPDDEEAKKAASAAAEESATSPAAAGEGEESGSDAGNKGAGMDQQKQNAGGAAKEPKPATVEELEQAFAGEDKFVLASYKKGHTLLEAKGAFADELKQRNDTLAKEHAALKQKHATEQVERDKEKAERDEAAAKAKPGNKPVSEARSPKAAAGGSDGSAIDEYESRVTELMTSRKLSREASAKRVLSEDEDLRTRYVAERNEQRDANIEDGIRARIDVRRRVTANA